MDLFKNRLKILGKNIVSISKEIFILILVLIIVMIIGCLIILVEPLAKICLYVLIFLVALIVCLAIYTFIEWLFIEPYKNHKLKSKNN